MKRVYKIGVIGPFASGKTLFIKSVSGGKNAYFTEKPVSEAHRRKIKETTTVAIDFTHMEWYNGNKVHLYGTPGQGHLSRILEMVDPVVEGYVLVLSSDHLEEVDPHIRQWVQQTSKPVVIALRTEDHTGVPTHIPWIQREVPVLPWDPSDRKSGVEVLKKLVDQLPVNR